MTTERPDDEGLEATQPFTSDDIGQPAEMPTDAPAAAPSSADASSADASFAEESVAAASAGGTAGEPPADSVVAPGTVIVSSTETGRRGGTRWGIALGAVAIAVGGLAAAAFLLTGQSPASRLVGWAPADAPLYAEARLDLPGDQRAQLGAFLSKFPGFSDQAILDQKIDEALDRIVSGATDGRQDFSTKIKPWFDGQVAMAATATTRAGATEPGSGLALVAVKDVAAARAWFEALAAERPMTLTTETYGGTELLVAADAQGAAAFLDGVMLLGDPTAVRAAIDTGGKGELAKAPAFVAARAAFKGDQLAFAYLDVHAALALAESNAGDAGGVLRAGEALTGAIPVWAGFAVRTDGSGLIAEAVWPHLANEGFTPENRAGRLADLVPASTIVLTDARDLGKVLTTLLTQARSDPGAAKDLEQLEQAATLLGGLDSLVGWIGDAGVAITRDGAAIDGGLVVVPADPAAADRLGTMLSGFLDLFGTQSGLSVKTEDHGGTEITIVDLGTVQELLGGALGAGLDLGGLPIDEIRPSGRVELAWAVRDDVVVIALGPAFVRSVLDVGPSTSLAADTRYRSLLELVGTENAGSTFVDLRAIREVGEGIMAAADGSAAVDYDRDVKPYLEPFDAWIQVNTVGGDLDRSIMRIAVE